MSVITRAGDVSTDLALRAMSARASVLFGNLTSHDYVKVLNGTKREKESTKERRTGGRAFSSLDIKFPGGLKRHSLRRSARGRGIKRISWSMEEQSSKIGTEKL